MGTNFTLVKAALEYDVSSQVTKHQCQPHTSAEPPVTFLTAEIKQSPSTEVEHGGDHTVWTNSIKP